LKLVGIDLSKPETQVRDRDGPRGKGILGRHIGRFWDCYQSLAAGSSQNLPLLRGGAKGVQNPMKLERGAFPKFLQDRHLKEMAEALVSGS